MEWNTLASVGNTNYHRYENLIVRRTRIVGSAKNTYTKDVRSDGKPQNVSRAWLARVLTHLQVTPLSYHVGGFPRKDCHDSSDEVFRVPPLAITYAIYFTTMWPLVAQRD